MTDEEKQTNQEKINVKQKIEDLINKDKERLSIKMKNMNTNKSFDMSKLINLKLVDFEKVKFDYIQKIAKKFNKITEENKKELLSDSEKYNFTKVLEEIIKNIVDSKFDFKDVNAMIIVLSNFNQIYENFSQKYGDYLKKHLTEFNEMLSKTQAKNDEDEEKRSFRKKTLLRLYIESFCYGLVNEFKTIHEIFLQLIQKKENLIQNFPILVNLLKIFAETIFGIKPKLINNLIEVRNSIKQTKEIENYELNYLLLKEQRDKYYNSFKDYYYKVVCNVLEEEHKNLVEMEKKNIDNMKKLESNQEILNSYTKQRTLYMKLMDLVNKFAEIMNFDVPELANENAFRYEESKKSEMKIEKINKYDPFTDEFDYIFYTNILNLKEKVSQELLEKKKKSTDLQKDKKLLSNKNINLEEERHRKYELMMVKILKADCLETIDEATIEFLNINSNKYRISIIKSMSKGSRTNYTVLKYFARFFANLNPYFKDFTQEIVSNLMEEFNLLMRQDKVTNLDERIRNIRFICELIKFDLFPVQNIFDLLKKIIDDFKGYSVDILCAIFENAGRFLYLNEQTHIKFNSFIENIKQMTYHKLSYDERAYNSVISCLNICKPNENLTKKAFKVRSDEELYIRFLIFQKLDKEKVRKVAILLRRMDWNIVENIVFRILYKFLMKGKETQVINGCNLLSNLKEHHPDLINNIIDSLFEELRVSFENNDFNDNQHKVHVCLIFSYFYTHSIIDSSMIFEVMYYIITFNPEWELGRREIVADNILDSPRDTVRVIMIVTILDNCGSHIKERCEKGRLEGFIHFFQIYILSKYYIPSDTENLILNCLENLFPNIKIYNDFNNALKDSKNFKGFNFDIDAVEETIDKISEAVGTKTNLKVIANKIENEDIEFKRKKEVKKEENYNFNIDEEIQKIINESMAKNKSTRIQTLINPLNDLKKKTLNKTSSPSKMKLITKQQNKVIVKEVNKNNN